MTREIKANVAQTPSRGRNEDPQRGATKLTGGGKTLNKEKKGCC